MLLQTPELDHQQLLALDELCTACKKTDGNLIAIYRHLLGKNRGRLSNILRYAAPPKSSGHPQTLSGFLSVFFFYEKSCEISLMVAPKFRRQGIATRMLKAIWPLIESEGVETLVFSLPHGLNDAWLLAMGLRYQNSEFQMQLTEQHPEGSVNACVRVATLADISALCAIDAACFSTHGIDMPSRFHLLLNDPAHCLFIITQDNVPVGKAHLNWQTRGARLSDIAIIPDAQQRGLGSALLAHCIHHALHANKPDIFLDVEATNKQALGLYTRLGFTINNALDYWKIDKFGLTDFLHHL